MGFADKLQRLRKAKQLSQEDLAEKCGVTRQSVSKWETGSGYPETDKLLALCDILDVNLDYLLRDRNDPPHENQKQEQPSSYTPYIGKWLHVFLKDKEFNGFYCVGLIAIQTTQLLFMDNKRKAVLIDSASVGAISEITDEKQIRKLPMIFTSEPIFNVRDYFINRKCDIKLKQGQPLFGFNKPGGFYSVVIAGISDEVVTVQDQKGSRHLIKMPDVLFIRECP